MPELLWPFFAESNPHLGQTDENLEKLCTPGLFGHDKRLGWKSVPWLFWPTELYSFGRCYREWLNWPRWLPIPVYGDHGVALFGDLNEHEKNNRSRYHLTWFGSRYEATNNQSEKKIIHIPHPWITYRRKKKITQNNDAIGTLIFYSHSNVGIEIEGYKFDEYFNSLKDLPDEYKPLVVCMHMHDINKGYHKTIRKYRLPITTAGNTSSPFFVDRFYDLIRQFKYATSNKGGSELFYCAEAGVEYFLYGQEPRYINHSEDQLPIGELKLRDNLAIYADERKKSLFRKMPPTIGIDKLRFVSDVLGLDVNEYKIAKRLKKIFIIEMIRLLPRYCYQLMPMFLSSCRKRGVMGSLKKLRQLF